MRRINRNETNSSDDVESIVIRSVSPSIEITLTPRHGMTSSQLHDITAVSRGNFARLTEIDELRERSIVVMDLDGDVEGTEEEWRHESREEECLSEDKEGKLEGLEDEEAESDSVEGNRPRLSSGLVRSVVDKQKLRKYVSERLEIRARKADLVFVHEVSDTEVESRKGKN